VNREQRIAAAQPQPSGPRRISVAAAPAPRLSGSLPASSRRNGHPSMKPAPPRSVA